MDYFILTMFVGIIGFIAGIIYGKFLLIKRIVNLLNDEEFGELQVTMNNMKNKVDAIMIPVLKQEIVNDNIYLYDDKGNFICQGATSIAAAERYGEIDSGLAVVECDNSVHYTIIAGKIKN